jgi:hypothetical protein
LLELAGGDASIAEQRLPCWSSGSSIVPSSAGELVPDRRRLAALRAGDGRTARRVFEFALGEAESGQVLEGLAEALYLECEYLTSAVQYERAYVVYRRDGTAMAAGRAARTLAWITANVLGDWAVRSGWLARARSILESRRLVWADLL